MIVALFQALMMHLARLRTYYAAAICTILFISAFVFFLFSGPTHLYPVDVIIPEGTSLSGSAFILQSNGILRFPQVYRAVALLERVHGVQAGTYHFEEKITVWTLVYRISHGDTGVPRIAVTFPEGTTVRQMGDMIAAKIPAFNAEHFKSISLAYEGFLFPDTYYITSSTTPEDMLERMRENFMAHDEWKQNQTLTELDERHAVILASILEAEGKTLEDRRIIAGILLKRMQVRMPLQVDAVFGYIYGKTGYTPTASDLKSNSAYNTYRMKGLPPTPINNPGEESLLAAVTPTTTAYLYYLTGTDGRMHYAETFTEHVNNKKLYLR